MPNFDSGLAIEIIKNRNPDMPVIIVSGTIGEEFAVNSMRVGASDYIMKKNMARLVPAIHRELREADARRDRQRIEKALHHVTHHDELTGLTNRAEFELRLRKSIKVAREENRYHALLYLDLDQFKIVNDTCGHAAGDSLLRQLVPVLAKPIRGRDTLARVGGDEFCILLENCPHEKAISIANLIRKLVEEFRFTWEKNKLGLSVSIGLVSITPESSRFEDLLSAVDLACNSAKEQGRNRVQVYHDNEAMLEQRRGEMLWATRLDMEKISLATKGDPQFFRWMLKRIDGTSFDAEVNISAINIDGDATVQAIVRDVTERVQAVKKLEDYKNSLEETVKKRTADLEEANKDMAAFSYSVSHDLRAPLRAIDGFSEALIEDCSDQLDSSGLDYLHRVRAGAQRMGDLIEDMLVLSRVAQRELNVVEISLSDIVNSSLSQLKSHEPERQVEVIVQDSVMARGDAHLMRIAIENLLANAWKYTSKTELPKIEFGTLENNGKTIYYVTDNGAGFDMRYVDKLFSPFQRLHNVDDFPGLGVGLATVKRIMKRHSGSIWAEAQVEKGATFSFTLP